MSQSALYLALPFTLLLSGGVSITSSIAAEAPGAAPGKPVAQTQQTGFGGPSSVGAVLDSDQASEAAMEQGLFDDYFAFKQQLASDYGFAFGFDYYGLIQGASPSAGEDIAAGGVFRAYGTWSLVGRESGNTGSLVYKVENRHRLATDIVPKDLGSETGYAGLTAVVFNDTFKDWALTNLFWAQKLLNNRVAFVVGDVDVTDYTDVFGLVNVWTEFSNYAFTTSPTIPAPDQGIGAAVRVMPTDHVYVIGGIADANGDPTRPDQMFDSFFNEAEYFTHAEIGWISSWEKRYHDNIHLTWWHVDPRQDSGSPEGWGLNLSFSSLVHDHWEPFFRVGFAEDGGALWERYISTGVAYHMRDMNDALGVGLNWSQPNDTTFAADLEDQYGMEIYYRMQLFKTLTVIPDVQFIFNPALNPDEDVVSVWGLRARLAF